MSTKDDHTKGTTQSVDKTAAAATEDEIAKRLSERVTAAYGPMRQCKWRKSTVYAVELIIN